MNKQTFIANIEAKPNFKKWVKTPEVHSTKGDIEHYHGEAYVSTPDGVNITNVWFMVDKATGDAEWQTIDTLTPEANTVVSKLKAMENYLANKYDAFFLKDVNTELGYAEAVVYSADSKVATKKTVLLYGNPMIDVDVT